MDHKGPRRTLSNHWTKHGVNEQMRAMNIIASAISKATNATRLFRRDEDGALIIFSLYAVSVMIMLGGIAVDVIVTEEKRTKLQYTIDGAVLAAADLNQTLDGAQIMHGHFMAAGFDEVRVNYTLNGATQPSIGPANAELQVSLVSTQGLNFRNVSASADIHVDTLFMHWMGVGYLTAGAAGAAEERITDIEISVVLDMSGSMDWDSSSGEKKMKELKDAARDFFDTVVVNDPASPGLTSVSIVPYNHTVVAGAGLLAQLNADGGIKTVTQETNPLGLAQVPTEQFHSTCVDFKDSDFANTRIDSTTALTRKPHYYWSSLNYRQPDMDERECDDDRTPILLHQTDPQKLKDHLNEMVASGNTAIDVGMKWGVAALDPGFRQAITALSAGPTLPSEVSGRPADYWDPNTSTDPQDETLKVIVLMTDGQNTTQWTLKDENEWPYIDFKNDKSDVWKFKNWSNYDNDWDSGLGRRLDWYDQYIVKIPENSTSQRWFRPGSPWTSSDDRWYHRDHLPHSGVEQQDWVTLFDEFSYTDIGDFFWKKARRSGYSKWDSAMRDKLHNAEKVFQDNSSANTRLQAACDAAKAKHVLIYAIGFEAETDGETAMKNCATSDGYYFDVDGEEIGTAFQAIANQINQLRLTQ